MDNTIDKNCWLSDVAEPCLIGGHFEDDCFWLRACGDDWRAEQDDLELWMMCDCGGEYEASIFADFWTRR